MARLRLSPRKKPTPSKQRSSTSTITRIKSRISPKTIFRKSPFVPKHVSFASNTRDRRFAYGIRVLHDAAGNEDEVCADEPRGVVDDSGSEEAEDWEDGTTLFSGFMENDSPSHPDTVNNNLRLVEDLQRPFSLGGEKLRQDLGEILVPTLNRIKEVHAWVDGQNNAQFQQAALGFQSASEEVTQQARNLKVEFEKEATESQAKTKELFHTVQRLYKQREDALAKYKETARRIMQEIREDLVEFERQVEEDTASAMKQAKSTGTDKKREKELMKLVLAATA